MEEGLLPTPDMSDSSDTLSTVRTSETSSTIPKSVCDALEVQGLVVDRRGSVGWDDGTEMHPRRWKLSRKMFDFSLVCFLEFFMTAISNTGSPVADVARSSLHISSTTSILSFTTTYLFGQAVGSIFVTPIAEQFGVRLIYVVSTFLFAVLCVLIGAIPRLEVIVVCRVLTGIISAIPATVAMTSIENMFDVRDRIWLMHIFVGFYNTHLIVWH